MTIGTQLVHLHFQGGEVLAYNVRIIEYPNGEIQVRRYSSPLERKEPDFYEKWDYDTNKYSIEPFGNQLVRIVEEFKPDTTRHATPEENATRSFNRTKQKIYEYSRCVNWEKFITLTFNPEKVDRYNFEECSRIARQWLHNQRRNAPDLQYLLVAEPHKDRAWHFHGLLANTGSMAFLDSGKRTENDQIIYNMSKWKYGFTTATEITNTHSVARYIGKYITKELCVLTKGKQRYFVSSNLPQPTSSTFLAEDDNDFNELLEMIANSYGVEVMHVSKPRTQGAFVDVDYYELQERSEDDTTESL